MYRPKVLLLLIMLIPLIAGAGPTIRLEGGSATIGGQVLASSTVEDLIPVIGNDVALDTGAGKMYWTAPNGKIQRANLDGTNPEANLLQIPPFPEAYPVGVALDLISSKMYWTNQTGGKIQRANLNGTSVETLVEGVQGVTGIALDLDEGKVYWAATNDNKIQRGNLTDLDGRDVGELTADGSVEDVVTSDLSGPAFIALDLGKSAIYWTEPEQGKVRRSNLDGTEVEDLVSGLSYPFGIDLDLSGQLVYWSDWNDDMIRRAPLNGSGGVRDVVAVNPQPSGISLDLTDQMVYLVSWGRGSGGKIQRAPLPAVSCTS